MDNFGIMNRFKVFLCPKWWWAICFHDWIQSFLRKKSQSQFNPCMRHGSGLRTIPRCDSKVSESLHSFHNNLYFTFFFIYFFHFKLSFPHSLPSNGSYLFSLDIINSFSNREFTFLADLIWKKIKMDLIFENLASH